MSTQTQTPAPAPTAANPGMLAMRRTLAGMAMCKALGLATRETPAAKAEAAPKAARKPAKPAREQASADEPEQMREYAVCVLVDASGAQTHVWATVSAPGPRRAGRQARALVAAQGHTTLGVAATLRDDAPQALLAIAK